MTSYAYQKFFWILLLIAAIILIDGYNLIRSDYPSDSKKGGVCIYYKEHIPLIKRDDICTLDNCLVTEIRSQREKCFWTCIYRPPGWNNEELKIFP